MSAPGETRGQCIAQTCNGPHEGAVRRPWKRLSGLSLDSQGVMMRLPSNRPALESRGGESRKAEAQRAKGR